MWCVMRICSRRWERNHVFESRAFLLAAHPDGIVAGDIGAELDIPPSTLSHHLDKLKNEDLVNVRRESTYLWYSANTEALQELLGFLYAECCTRNKAIAPQAIVQLCR
ncbi:MAG TPA: helix-turn-helix domain-containing protein [Bryobacteraceae bacterium]|nr:helix-turn-helix domain-containing protein [Bryobacteraceae bacterium]